MTVHLGTRVDADRLIAEKFDDVVIATGVTPRVPDIPGIDHPSVMTYADAVLATARSAIASR